MIGNLRVIGITIDQFVYSLFWSMALCSALLIVGILCS
jgi:hypothetical protein